MLSPNASRVLKKARKSVEKRVGYNELESEYKWTRADAQSACNQLIEKGYAKATVNHGTHGEELSSGIVLTEEGRYKRYRFFAFGRASFAWFTEHMVEIAALLLSILALLRG